ncbi:MAG: chorismate mutase [Anaerolineae bacterium]
MTCIRGVRGATTSEENTEAQILACTRELLDRMVTLNGIEPPDIGSVVFTVTPDLTATFPAKAARDLGWVHVPLMCAQEIPVPGSLQRCVRVMLLWNTDRSQDEVAHVYLRGAVSLRPDLAASQEEGEGR